MSADSAGQLPGFSALAVGNQTTTSAGTPQVTHGREHCHWCPPGGAWLRAIGCTMVPEASSDQRSLQLVVWAHD